MNGTLRILFILPLLFVSISATTDAYGHSLFNSSEQTLGDYRVQIATQPEFPQIGERSQILIRVTDQDGKEVKVDVGPKGGLSDSAYDPIVGQSTVVVKPNIKIRDVQVKVPDSLKQWKSDAKQTLKVGGERNV